MVLRLRGGVSICRRGCVVKVMMFCSGGEGGEERIEREGT